MDIVGLGFGVIAEARTVTQSIVRRVENCRQGRASFKKLERQSRSFGAEHRRSRQTDRKIFRMRFLWTSPTCSTAL